MATRRAMASLRNQVEAIVADGPTFVFVSTHSAREDYDLETTQQQCPSAVVELSCTALIVLIDPMLEDPPQVVQQSFDERQWSPVHSSEDCWQLDGTSVRLLALRFWASEDPSWPLGKLAEGFDLAEICKTVLAAGGVLAVGCTGHVRAVWDSLNPSGLLLSDPWQRPGKNVVRSKSQGHGIVFDRTGLRSCEDRCGAFHYNGPCASAL